MLTLGSWWSNQNVTWQTICINSEKEKLPISPSIESRVLFRPDGMAMTDRPTVERPNGIYEKDLPELRQVAIPVARYLLAQGLPMGEICITTSYVDVSTPEAGTPFTDEE